MKIAFFGLGGVGGYMAAHLTHHYREDSDMEFYYIARGAHLEAIKEHGLTLTKDSGESIIAHPRLATNNCKDCPKMDYIVYATKSYSIESNIEQLRELCDENTTIITFMNGVDGYPKLQGALPDVKIHQGCVYIFSWIESPGKIIEKGGYAHYYIGSPSPCRELEILYEIAAPAMGDEITYQEDIESRIWWKYSRISVFATTTTHHNITSGQIKETPEYMAEYEALSREFFAVAKALGKLEEDQVYSGNLKMLETSPYSATSSMQRDFYAARMSELDSLTGYISKMGRELGIKTEIYDRAYQDLLAKL